MGCAGAVCERGGGMLKDGRLSVVWCLGKEMKTLSRKGRRPYKGRRGVRENVIPWLSYAFAGGSAVKFAVEASPLTCVLGHGRSGLPGGVLRKRSCWSGPMY